MPISPIHPSPIQQRTDAPGQPASAPASLTRDVFQAARNGDFGPEFLLSAERPPAQGVLLPPLLDSYLNRALQVLGQPDREMTVEAVFEKLAWQPKPLGFESQLRELMNQTQATQSMPDASEATIDLDALDKFVQQNPSQALSRPEILVMLVICLDLTPEDNERWQAFHQEGPQQHINSMRGVVVSTAAESLWNEVEVSVGEPESPASVVSEGSFEEDFSAIELDSSDSDASETESDFSGADISTRELDSSYSDVSETESDLSGADIRTSELDVSDADVSGRNLDSSDSDVRGRELHLSYWDDSDMAPEPSEANVIEMAPEPSEADVIAMELDLSETGVSEMEQAPSEADADEELSSLEEQPER